jgi:Mg2+ and Co2+ transporter CorA
MNFEHIPEHRRHRAYPGAFWLVMLGVAGVMLVYFGRKKWL